METLSSPIPGASCSCGHAWLHWRMVTNVRNAKAHLSELLDRAAAGEEIVITSDGKPKARIVAVGAAIKPFRVNRRLLARRARENATPAEVLVRDDRDTRD